MDKMAMKRINMSTGICGVVFTAILILLIIIAPDNISDWEIKITVMLLFGMAFSYLYAVNINFTYKKLIVAHILGSLGIILLFLILLNQEFGFGSFIWYLIKYTSAIMIISHIITEIIFQITLLKNNKG